MFPRPLAGLPSPWNSRFSMHSRLRFYISDLLCLSTSTFFLRVLDSWGLSDFHTLRACDIAISVISRLYKISTAGGLATPVLISESS